jgi:shikimate dehydrogenase
MAATTTPAGRRFLVGLIGAGIQQSLSPAMHEREAELHGARLHYHLIDLALSRVGPDDLGALLDAAERTGFAGLNITHPCKQSVVPLLHELSDDAAAIGAVNTVVFRDGRRIGHNTDWSGFTLAFEQEMKGVALGAVLVLGAGGAGSAVSHALLRLGAGRLRIVDTEPARAEALAARLTRHFGPGRAAAARDAAEALAGADGLVHATPTGMASHPGVALDPALLPPALWLTEVVYFPLETQLLREARARGCRTMDGGSMAAGQAAGAFRLFTGLEPDPVRMRAHFGALVAGGRP